MINDDGTITVTVTEQQLNRLITIVSYNSLSREEIVNVTMNLKCDTSAMRLAFDRHADQIRRIVAENKL